jgi:putative tryptophan/tyrosine transport system substrate-binding protein
MSAASQLAVSGPFERTASHGRLVPITEIHPSTVLRDPPLRLIGISDKLGASRGERSMRRRGFIGAIAGVVAARQTLRSRVAFAQAEKTRRISVLVGLSESNSDFRGFVAAFADELARSGWIDGRNARIEQRWTNADVNRASAFAQEMVATQPDVIVTSTTPATAAVKRETSTIPIVFTIVSDPVGSGFVAALPRPGGNITGFTQTDAGMGGKWLDLLKEIAPDIKRAGIMFNPDTAPSSGKFFLGSFEAAARALAVEPVPLPVRSDSEIETAIAPLGREQAALALMDDSFMGVHYPKVIAATARNKVPAIFVGTAFVKNGGLLSYGADFTDIFRRAAGYVDRILRGENPADLPVQLPTKFDMAINLKTAKSLGLSVPPALLATADEVIE